MGRNKKQTKKNSITLVCLLGMSSNSVLLNANIVFFMTKMVKHLCFLDSFLREV